MLFIRKAAVTDLPQLLPIFECAKAFMAATGNPTQWQPGYPGAALMASEIDRGVCYVCCNPDGKLEGTFCLIPGAEPTYAQIEAGAWPSNAPYATIHRIASAGRVSGMAKLCFDWCAEQGARGLDLRIDTHADNTVMQSILAKNGFVYCGIIHLADGSPRLAYLRGCGAE